ncbi:MAG TPA: branched-chain amino acid transport system II carrier protein [Candidatus Megaira endosymbiont of Nemacystus decipiens]|nr:branched-chain amino acid transport system II carrier protein [Candidatus Megaera endosymbiont of Nemacystus decipiens]
MKNFNENNTVNNPRSLLYGFSIFSMFFGSGNLVFPLMIGVENPNHWLMAFIGFFTTGILLPFLGLFVIKLYKGSYINFFAEAGVLARLAIPFFTLSLLGPFGVIPRCITVAHGGLEFLNFNIPLSLFSLIFCIICYISCQNNERMFNVLGKILTPFLLICLILLFVAGYASSEKIIIPENTYSSFKKGFMKGYITMDLFASFFFSSLIFKRIESLTSKCQSESEMLLAALKPSLIGAAILGFVYFGFVFLGAHYQFLAPKLTSEHILPAISKHLFGVAGSFVIAIIMLLSCLTTSVALSGIYVNYLKSLKIFNNQSYNIILITTTFISFLISLLDFEGILMWLTPLLDISYPGLITLTIMCLLTRKKRIMKTVFFYSVIIITALFIF